MPKRRSRKAGFPATPTTAAPSSNCSPQVGDSAQAAIDRKRFWGYAAPPAALMLYSIVATAIETGWLSHLRRRQRGGTRVGKTDLSRTVFFILKQYCSSILIFINLFAMISSNAPHSGELFAGIAPDRSGQYAESRHCRHRFDLPGNG
jgi:hypothetical protein